jgi:hypothetical protein
MSEEDLERERLNAINRELDRAPEKLVRTYRDLEYDAYKMVVSAEQLVTITPERIRELAQSALVTKNLADFMKSIEVAILSDLLLSEGDPDGLPGALVMIQTVLDCIGSMLETTKKYQETHQDTSNSARLEKKS